MAQLGGQTGSQSQSGQYSGNTSFNNSGTQTGTSDTTNKTTQTGTQTSQQAGSNTVNTTGIYNTAGQNAAGALGGSGLTGGQQNASDYMQYQLANQPVNWGLAGVNSAIGDTTGTKVLNVNSDAVNGFSGADFTSPYRNQYAQDVLNPSLAAFDNSTAMQDNAVRAGRDAGSAFGSRAGVADDVRAGQNALARGALAGNILGQGYQTALGAGQTDASRAYGASGQNAGNQLTASGQNAGNQLAQEGLALQGEGMQAGNLNSINSNGLNTANAAYNMGGGGFNNFLNLAGSQVPAFGGSSTGSSSGASTNDILNTISSMFSGASTNTGTGTSSGTSSSQGGSSSKGAGLSIPFPH